MKTAADRGMVGGMRRPPFKPILKKAKHGFKGYPIATVMLYGPDDPMATKVAIGIVLGEKQEPAALRAAGSAARMCAMTRRLPTRSEPS